MAIKSVITSQTDFTGEIPATNKTGALWRFNEAAPDNLHFADSSGHNRVLTASGWAGTTAQMIAGKLGRYYRQNTNAPTTEKWLRVGLAQPPIRLGKRTARFSIPGKAQVNPSSTSAFIKAAHG